MIQLYMRSCLMTLWGETFPELSFVETRRRSHAAGQHYPLFNAPKLSEQHNSSSESDEDCCCWKRHYFSALNDWISEPRSVRPVFSFQVLLTFQHSSTLLGLDERVQ